MSIVIEFCFPGDSEPVQTRVVVSGSAPADVNAVTEEARTSRTSFSYSGRHDHGELPVLRSTGPLAELVASLQEAKRQCDAYLTKMIAPPANEEKRLRLETSSSSSGGGDGVDEIKEEEDHAAMEQG